MFVENVGQLGGGALFQVSGGDRTVWLAEDAVWVSLLAEPCVSPGATEEKSRPAFAALATGKGKRRPVEA